MATDHSKAAEAFRRFVAIVQSLRTPGTGCPWDLEQTHQSLRRYLVEECYEVLDAIDAGDDVHFREELGDLLLQVVLHAQLADDRGAFAIAEVIEGIADKMVRRHPHVFGTLQVRGSADVVHHWEQIKAAEKAQKGDDAAHAAKLARLPAGLPALLRAQRLGDKAAKVGFDWPSLAAVLAKVREEFAALEAKVSELSAAASPESIAAEQRQRLEQELGDVLFSLSQLARRVGLDAEEALRAAGRRFVDRFRRMETNAARPLTELSRDELLAAWQAAKDGCSAAE